MKKILSHQVDLGPSMLDVKYQELGCSGLVTTPLNMAPNLSECNVSHAGIAQILFITFARHNSQCTYWCNKTLLFIILYINDFSQELKFYFKYIIHKNLPSSYLLDWEFISNANIHLHDTRTSNKSHTVRTKQEFAKNV